MFTAKEANELVESFELRIKQKEEEALEIILNQIKNVAKKGDRSIHYYDEKVLDVLFTSSQYGVINTTHSGDNIIKKLTELGYKVDFSPRPLKFDISW